MLISGEKYTSIWIEADGRVKIIDQRHLPHQLVIKELSDLDDFLEAIQLMMVRGAPLIGVTAGFGLASALAHDPNDENFLLSKKKLLSTRPTAINLAWALQHIGDAVKNLPKEDRAERALSIAQYIYQRELENSRLIGQFGADVISKIFAEKKGKTVNILTHCNAGWLATVDLGTATAPIYTSATNGIPIHVFVDETRPRNQGANLTCWEFSHNGISHDLIVDNSGGHLMQNGEVDLVLVGSDRTTKRGDVCNKIGTYLKALAASDNAVPFYVALPTSTIDWHLSDGIKEIPIEERSQEEVSHVEGMGQANETIKVQICPDNTNCRNPAFDVTPNRLVDGLITEKGICAANEIDMKGLLEND